MFEQHLYFAAIFVKLSSITHLVKISILTNSLRRASHVLVSWHADRLKNNLIFHRKILIVGVITNCKDKCENNFIKIMNTVQLDLERDELMQQLPDKITANFGEKFQ